MQGFCYTPFERNQNLVWYTRAMELHSAGTIRAMVIFNPNAGQAAAVEQMLREACDVWRNAGWTIDLRPTQAAGDATRLAREAVVQGYDLAIAAGGDGTVNEVVNGLVHSTVALGTLPIGTVNVWAREIGMPLQPRAAAKALLDAQRQQIDVGRAGDRYFLLMASIGFDATVTATVRSDHKRWLGAFAYVVQGLKVAFSYQGVRARIVLDGKAMRGRYLMIVLGNSQLYGGVVKLTAEAVIDDGLLDVCLIKGRTLLGAPLRMWSIMRRRYADDAKIMYYRARHITFTTKQPVDVQVDGDHLGSTPSQYEAIPGALFALIPSHAPQQLLSGAYGVGKAEALHS